MAFGRLLRPLMMVVTVGGGAAWIWRSYRRFYRGLVPILAYHALTNDPEQRHDLFVQQVQFERQMRWLVRHGYETVSCLAPIAGERGQADHRVGITFDDGFASVHRFALPVIRELGLRCAIFVSTDYVGHDTHFPWAYAECEKPLSWEEVKELCDGGFEVGSHAASHRPLPDLDDAELDAELRESRRVIQMQTGSAATALAYPHGLFDERTKRASRAAGYVAAFAVLSAPETADTFSVPRILIRNQTSMLGFRLRMAGIHPFLKTRPAFRFVRPLLARYRWAFL